MLNYDGLPDGMHSRDDIPSRDGDIRTRVDEAATEGANDSQDGGFVKKSSFSKSSSQTCLSLGQATRRCDPLHRRQCPATTASHKRLRRLLRGKDSYSVWSSFPPLEGKDSCLSNFSFCFWLPRRWGSLLGRSMRLKFRPGFGTGCWNSFLGGDHTVQIDHSQGHRVVTMTLLELPER